jgi:predicted permease
MGTLRDGLRYAFRQFRLSPVFTSATVLTLALGIGGTTAIFTLIHAVMLKSLPVVDPERLYRIGSGDDCCVEGGPQDEWGMFSYDLFRRLEASAPEFEQITAFQAGANRLSVRREHAETTARPLRSEYVTGTYFSTLGVSPFGGRLFSPSDDTPSSAPVAVLSHHAWQSIYGSDSSIVGSTFVVEGHPFTIAGVAPPGFFGDTLRGNPPDLWLPVQQEPLVDGGGGLVHQPIESWLRVIGRLRSGASTAGMAPRLTGVLRQWMEFDAGYPANWNIKASLAKQSIAVVPAGSGVGEMKEEYGRSLQILFAVCGLVLLIACANVANLLLARAMARRSQTAVRLALGASRRQIVMQALVESILLAIGGALAGLLVAVAAAKLLISLAFSGVAFLPISTSPSWIVLGFAFGLALLTGIVFGAAPAWFATRTNPIDALRGAGRTTGDHSSLTRKALLVVQATLAVVLVAGSTLLARSLDNLQHQDFGYPIDGRVEVALNPPPATYPIDKIQSLYRDIEQHLNALPGVQGVGLALYNPLTDNWGELILIDGHPAPQMGENAGASWDRVSANYLATLGVSVLRGRGFTPADNETSEPVAVVNEAFVKRFFKSGEDPIGHHFGLDLPQYSRMTRIVGIVRDAKFAGFALRQPARPMFFAPLAQSWPYTDDMMKRIDLQSHYIGGILLSTSEPPAVLEPLLKRTLGEIDPNLTIISVRTLEQQVSLTFEQMRADASLAGLFGIIALILAAVGLYGVTAYSVTQRTNEIGIRMALGANRTRVIDLVLRSAFARVAVGLVLGLPLAVLAGRLISAQLYGVSYWDPLALTVATVALGACAFVAAIIPAARAAGLSPIKALRTE